jgi:hypothetical protein
MTNPRKEIQTMTDTGTNFDFNTAGEQKVFDMIPAQTVCVLQLNIRRGGAGPDGWLKRSADGNSEGLDCEFIVVGGQYAKRRLWQLFTLSGTTPGHAEAGEISRNTLRAILESGLGIHPDDKSEAAQAARKVSGWGTISTGFASSPVSACVRRRAVIRPRTPSSRSSRRTVKTGRNPSRSGTRPPSNGGSTPLTSAPPAGSIARPDWGR